MGLTFRKRICVASRPRSWNLALFGAVAVALSLIGAGEAKSAAATPIPTMPGLNQVKPVFEENGFNLYRATYVRCYTNAQWKKVRRGKRALMGWYDGGSWIHVRSATCTNAAKLLNEGQLNATTATALATVVHETIHRQGFKNEAETECLSHFMTAHVVKAWTGSAEKGLATLASARAFAIRNLPARYLLSDNSCASFALDWGVQPIEDETEPAPAPAPPPPPVNPPPPVAPPPPPPPPAQPVVLFDRSSSIEAGQGGTNWGHLEEWQINSARRIEVTFTVGPGEGGWWSCARCSIMDMGRGAQLHNVGFGVLKPGESHSTTVTNLSGLEALTNFVGVYPYTERTVEIDAKGFPTLVTRARGTLTARVVGYSY